MGRCQARNARLPPLAGKAGAGNILLQGHLFMFPKSSCASVYRVKSWLRFISIPLPLFQEILFNIYPPFFCYTVSSVCCPQSQFLSYLFHLLNKYCVLVLCMSHLIYPFRMASQLRKHIWDTGHLDLRSVFASWVSSSRSVHCSLPLCPHL